MLRRTRFDLAKAEARAHILEGLRIALDNIDAVIELIRDSANPDEARERLTESFELSEIQAQAILTMPLQRLTGLERDKIEEEYQQLQETIRQLKHILENRDAQMQILKTNWPTFGSASATSAAPKSSTPPKSSTSRT